MKIRNMIREEIILLVPKKNMTGQLGAVRIRWTGVVKTRTTSNFMLLSVYALKEKQ